MTMTEADGLKLIGTDDAWTLLDELKKVDVEIVNERICPPSSAKQVRLLVLQELLATANQPGYGKRQQMVAQKLGITVRSVRRLVK